MIHSWARVGCIALLTLTALGCGDDETKNNNPSGGATCGNGSVEADETCDDGNTDAGDGCSSTCQVEGDCGNGDVDPGEGCDDGNTTSGDGCSQTCSVETGECGDGTTDDGEECDDGNTRGGDGCSARCQDETSPVCGDGTLDPDEECDDGNDIPSDGCEDDCTASPGEVICEQLTATGPDNCDVVAGTSGIVLKGDVLAPVTIFRGGQVAVDAAGEITCVGCDCEASMPDATVVTCANSVISPGLINAHDHITFTQNNPYTATSERYEHRHDWRIGANGHTEINSSGGASTDRVRWGELRFMLGGATSIIGSGSATGFLRNLDRADQEGLNQPQVQYDTFPLGDSNGTQLKSGCNYPNIENNIAGEDAYFPHISEGINAVARNEFLCTESARNGGEDLLEPQSAYIHSIGLTPLDYARMADQGTSLIWSPRSNITLYGDTAWVSVADRMGVDIALGTDWMPTGSMNLFRELSCADSFNQAHLNGYFSDRQLWAMSTQTAAKAAAMDDVIGALAPGLVADISIFDASSNADYRAIIAGEPQDVVLVLRGGEALYGDENIIASLGSGVCDTLDVCGSGKSLCSDADIGKSLSALTASVGTIYPLFFCGPPNNEPSCVPMRGTSVDGSSNYTGVSTVADPDGDGLEGALDNCPDVFNPIRPLDDGVQADFDGDGVGDPCDPCPMTADSTVCDPFDPTDVDGDGVTNLADNCPENANPGQEDADSDDKGDLCDACPNTSNPGANACPVTIYDIKSGAASGQVAVLDALVTGCVPSNGYYVQVKETDAGYQGPDNSGIFTFDPTTVCTGAAATLSVGDRIDITNGAVADFFGQIQLNNTTHVVVSSGETAPAPIVVTPAQAGGTMPTGLESVVVQVQNVLVSAVNPPAGPGDSNPTNEFVVDGQLRVNDYIFAVTPLPSVGTSYTSLTGILDYRNGNSKLEPRSAADLVLGAPVLIDFTPGLSFVRVGETGVPTIPTALTVTLSSPAEGATFVSISSGTPSALTVVGDGVTIPDGATSAPVLLNGLTQNAAVSLSATLDATMLMADVRVVGAAETPSVVSITPGMGLVAPMGTLDFSVLLDIPAPVGGSSVGLAVVGLGSVPASVTIPANQTTAPFTFTAGNSEGAGTIEATLGGTVTADVTIAQGGGLVINEIDYDQVASDTNEFVEILNTTGGSLSLSDLALVFINGSNNAEYRRVDLVGAGSLAGGQYLVVGSPTLLATVPGTALTLPIGGTTDTIQNGAPDAVGLFDLTSGMLVDALSYEGGISMGVVTGFGPFTFVEGLMPSVIADTNTGTESLIRFPNGVDTDNALNDWVLGAVSSPGAPNAL